MIQIPPAAPADHLGRALDKLEALRTKLLDEGNVPGASLAWDALNAVQNHLRKTAPDGN